MAQPVPENINFSGEEEKTLKFWNDIKAFEESLKQSKDKPRFTFYDGPPFATGLPHYGHILTSTIKDVVTRYAHQKGFHVERRFGWDCHGLPVEYEIDKSLGVKGPQDVYRMGIDKYNAECRKIVSRYSSQWEEIIKRLGRWIDFENDYKTMYPWFMESVWWVFSELWNKGLVYRGIKVMPYSTACATPLSNFESGQNYKEVVDPAVIVSFPLKSCPEVSLIAWTTTPWTLPSNLSLCVNPDLTYVKVKEFSTGQLYILMEERLIFVFKKEENYEILDRFVGSKLKGEKYEPLLPYYANMKSAFVVLTDNYVTSESGTGVVHQAPYFGEDDYRVCLLHNVITKDQEPICPVDESGKFTDPIKDFLGLHVKEADPKIIKHLTNIKRLVQANTTKHSYPFCWRSETPLIYKAVPSWFIRVENLTQDLIRSNSETYWVPDFIKDKRFGNWLKDARDWAISRNRFWGTPIPLWVSSDMKEIVCISSIKELSQLSGKEVTDLHRENIDHLEIPSRRAGQPPLKRIPEVFDCWFESGSMPYAQQHYPFKNADEFKNIFPADFIAEGIDQTRGWFYTLLVLSTALFKKPPFKNLIANGLVLASDGQKMSKRKKNYPDPMEVINKYGSDALRLYLINSPVVRAENLRFKEEGVRDILKDLFLPWYNAYRFFIQNVLKINVEQNIDWKLNTDAELSSNIMDRWILSFTQSLQLFVHKEMAAYRLYTVVPRLVQFIDNLTNWYVRMNRTRLKGEDGIQDCREALSTLGNVIYSMVRFMSPYTPFMTELMYQNLKNLADEKAKSVHFLLMPKTNPGLICSGIESAVSKMQVIIELGRVIRDRKTIPIKYPLREAVVILNETKDILEVTPLEIYIQKELNVKIVSLTTDKEAYGVNLRAEPDHKVLGARLKSDFKSVMQAIKELSNDQLVLLRKEGKLTVLGHEISPEDVRFRLCFTGPMAEELAKRYEPNSSNDILLLLDICPDKEMQDEGIAREIINRIQKLRKAGHLVPTDPVRVFYNIENKSSELYGIAMKFHSFIENAVKAPVIVGIPPSDLPKIVDGSYNLLNTDMTIVLTGEKQSLPFCKFVKLRLCGLKPDYGRSNDEGFILLENPVNKNVLDFDGLRSEIEALFGLYGKSFVIYNKNRLLVSKNNFNQINEELFILPSVSPSKYTDDISANINGRFNFVNVDFNKEKCTVLCDDTQLDTNSLVRDISKLFNVKSSNLSVQVLANDHLMVSQN